MTPKEMLLEKYKNQTAIAEAIGVTRQAVSIAFSRGRLSYQMAHALSKKLRVPIDALLVEWYPGTRRPRAASFATKQKRQMARAATGRKNP